jgi:hypothetical protein
MAAPKEVWVAGYSGTPGAYVYLTREEASRCNPNATVHRYVITREKREPIAWVVRGDRVAGTQGSEFVACDGSWTTGLSLARRWSCRSRAERYVDEKGLDPDVVRVVALVRRKP